MCAFDRDRRVVTGHRSVESGLQIGDDGEVELAAEPDNGGARGFLDLDHAHLPKTAWNLGLGDRC
jgi:hypothetical protein